MFAVGLSTHPVPALAVGEVVGQVIEAGGTGPDVLVLFAGASLTGALEDIVAAVQRLLRPVVLVGCTTSTVLVHDQVVRDGGIALWAGYGLDAYAARARDDLPDVGTPVIGLADPFTHASVGLGGLASAARGPGGNRLVLDHDVFHDGAVFLALDGAQVGADPADAALVFAGPDGIELDEDLALLPLAGMHCAVEPPVPVVTITGAPEGPG